MAAAGGTHAQAGIPLPGLMCVVCTSTRTYYVRSSVRRLGYFFSLFRLTFILAPKLAS